MKQEHTFPEDPIEMQIGGTHYLKHTMQPLLTAESAGLTPIQYKIINYVTRHIDKNGIEDLEKALHTAKLGLQYTGLHTTYEAPDNQKILFIEYCRLNNLKQYERLFIHVLNKKYLEVVTILNDMILMWDASAPNKKGETK